MASEAHAARALLARGLEVRERRLRTPFAEVDVLAFDPSAGRFVLVEVKTQGPAAWAEGVVSPAQIARLRRARAWLEGRLRAPVAAELAIVARDGSVAWTPDFLC